MATVVLVIHLIVSICLIGLVLLQRSEGGALGMGGGGGALMTGRGAADALARMTTVAGAFFLATSISLTVISGAARSGEARSVFDLIPRQERTAPVPVPAPEPAESIQTRPDPTESAAPEAAETELAALSQVQPAAAPAAPIAIAPSPAVARERAGPLVNRPIAAAGPLAAARQPPPAAPRNLPASLPPPARTPAPAIVPPVVVEAPAPESVEANTGVEAVRRERAGPDQ